MERRFGVPTITARVPEPLYHRLREIAVKYEVPFGQAFDFLLDEIRREAVEECEARLQRVQSELEKLKKERNALKKERDALKKEIEEIEHALEELAGEPTKAKKSTKRSGGKAKRSKK